MYRRFGSKVTVVEKFRQAAAARGRGRRRRDPRHPRARGRGDPPGRGRHERFDRHGDGFRSTRMRNGERRKCRAATCCSRSGRIPNTDDLGLKEGGIAADARGYITVDDQCRTSAEGVWALGDVQRQGRVHAHLLERLRDRRRQPVRQRPAQDLRPDSLLRAVHRPAARARRHERGRGEEERPQAARRQDAHDPRRPRARDGRDAGLHEGAGGRRDRRTPRRRDPRPERRRNRALAAGRDVREDSPIRRSSGRCTSTRRSPNSCRRCWGISSLSPETWGFEVRGRRPAGSSARALRTANSSTVAPSPTISQMPMI